MSFLLECNVIQYYIGASTHTHTNSMRGQGLLADLYSTKFLWNKALHTTPVWNKALHTTPVWNKALHTTPVWNKALHTTPVWNKALHTTPVWNKALHTTPGVEQGTPHYTGVSLPLVLCLIVPVLFCSVCTYVHCSIIKWQPT